MLAGCLLTFFELFYCVLNLLATVLLIGVVSLDLASTGTPLVVCNTGETLAGSRTIGDLREKQRNDRPYECKGTHENNRNHADFGRKHRLIPLSDVDVLFCVDFSSFQGVSQVDFLVEVTGSFPKLRAGDTG